ncbi:MAG: hypothetical protein SynsKO_25480 [Synoicihabitans sp.]
MRFIPGIFFVGTLVLVMGMASTSAAEENYEAAPIHYSGTEPNDPISRLQEKLAAGEYQFLGSEEEILQGLLAELDVPKTSQVLVFSRTSLQRHRISPENPRAIYFSDDMYVGWVPGGLIEITSVDPVLGPIFYAVSPRALRAASETAFKRDSDCLRCHGGHFVRGIPGVMVRSVFPDDTGEPIFRLGSTLVDYRTPFEERWGGWYVTGRHGRSLHRGNIFAIENSDETVQFPIQEGANVTDLSAFFDVERYPVSGSDIVALMVFEHQTAVQNAITKASLEARRMLHYQAEMQATFKEPVTTEPSFDSVKSVFNSVAEQLVDALLSKDEAPMPRGVMGAPEFVASYEKTERRTSAGHALRDLSLQGRLYKYRCSPLIYTEMFGAMPESLKAMVYQRLASALDPANTEGDYTYLPSEERRAIRSILQETLPEIRPYLADT